jgi:rhodanese-related sulfurtransferase
MNQSPLRAVAAGVLGILILAAATASTGDTASRITKEDARAMLGNAEVIFIDVRQPHDWDSSKSKIKGAAREQPERVDDWMKEYPKEKSLILYCA